MNTCSKTIINTSLAACLTFCSSLWGEQPEPVLPVDTLLTQRMDSLNQAIKVSSIVGMNVRNLQGEKLGDVENLLVELSSGRLIAVVISSGGFLGMGEELSAIPPMAMRYSEGGDFLQMDATREWLANAPHFNAQQWPDFAQPTTTLGLYRAYGIDVDTGWFKKPQGSETTGVNPPGDQNQDSSKK
jgi:sporulation protein YlmC with PRC-barrel domain